MIDVKKLDLKPGDILGITFDDDLDGDTFERVAAQLAPVCKQIGVMALFLERAVPVVVSPEGALLAVKPEALREALRVLLDVESIEDSVYSVRERAGSDAEFKGNSWDHPRVKAFSDAIEVLKALRTAVTPPAVEEEEEEAIEA